jgi:hypothetical protein
MEKTLEAICVPSKKRDPISPGRFALFHNGITLHATSADRTEAGLVVKLPSVLNGCQTVKTSFLFSKEPNRKPLIDHALWDQIPVPVRVIVSLPSAKWRELVGLVE